MNLNVCLCFFQNRVYFINFATQMKGFTLRIMRYTMKNLQQNKCTASEIIVVIGRQFGSGGREVGRLVASALGIAYYDKELLKEASDEFGISREIFADADEKRPSPFRSLLQGIYGIADNFHTTSMSGERLYQAQSDIIRSLAAKGSCVIVGRTGDYVMRDHPGMTSVFLHAPISYREEEIVKRGDAMIGSAAAELARRHDRDREDYYNYYTGRHWGRADNYHMSLDVSLLGHEGAAAVITEFVKHRLSLTPGASMQK